jgi:hypothetical protein
MGQQFSEVAKHIDGDQYWSMPLQEHMEKCFLSAFSSFFYGAICYGFVQGI